MKGEILMTQGIKAKDIRDFEKAVEKLEAVVARIRKYRPEATAFLDNGDDFRLISDADEYDNLVMQGEYTEADELIVTRRTVMGFSCGAEL